MCWARRGGVEISEPLPEPEIIPAHVLAQDTGWREIAPLVQPPVGVDASRSIAESFQIRRIGSRVLVYLRIKTTSGSGWSLSADVPGFTSPYPDLRSGPGIPVLISGRTLVLSNTVNNGARDATGCPGLTPLFYDWRTT